MKRQKIKWLLLILIAFYVFTHIFRLTILPVFADESIYIRWAQLIIDDWQQYAFFPLNDGKTPLMIWLFIPFQLLFTNPLFAARLVSVLAGLGQMLALGYLVKILGGKRLTVWLSMVFTAILPFWFFHHRMALLDGLMTLFITLTIIGAVRLTQLLAKNLAGQSFWQMITNRKTQQWIWFTGLSLAAALWTKLPAVLTIPSLFLLPFSSTQLGWKKIARTWLVLILSIGLGLVGFVTLKLHPAFSQLFGRGSDFLFPWQEVILQGGWRHTLRNVPTYIQYFGTYLTWPLLVIVLAGLFSPEPARRRLHHVLFWSALVFFLPIALLGRVVYPRYFLPIAIYFTTGVVLSLENLVSVYVLQQQKTWKQLAASIGLALLATNIVTFSSMFIIYSLVNPNYLPFVSIDKEQYLHEWSSGHGIVETVQRIQRTAQYSSVAIATEGSFGTLPDGVLMYLHNQDVSNIYVEGIGWPVKSIPENFRQRAAQFDQVWLVINSHRIELELPNTTLLEQFCRPNQAPCLQVYDVTQMVKTE